MSNSTFTIYYLCKPLYMMSADTYTCEMHFLVFFSLELKFYWQDNFNFQGAILTQYMYNILIEDVAVILIEVYLDIFVAHMST